jgi:pimeloyl-ACP methyl ester carboxylesterase
LQSVVRQAPTAGDPIPPNPLSAFTYPYQRLGLYDPTSNSFVPVTPNDSRLVGKNVTVLVHGWAAGYETWVNAAAKDGYVLTWWDTFLSQRPNSIPQSTAPASAWLLNGHTNKGIVESNNGMAWDFTHFGNPSSTAPLDPNAAVLAYTWIDESGTGYTSGYKAEAKTTLNGQRLAVALEEVLGSEKQFGGKLQLLGHSFGSKVATTAADALVTAPTANHLTVNQLTILDSPESNATGGSTLAEAGSTNDNWYFLQDLPIARDYKSNSDTVFVDNYISKLDEPYSATSYTKSGKSYSLPQVVDVSLNPANYNAGDTGQHTYAAYWYGGSSEKTLSKPYQFGRQWSPLVSGSNVPSTTGYLQQWTDSKGNPVQSKEFNLQPTTFSTYSPNFTVVKMSTESSTPGATMSYDSTYGDTVTLKQSKSTTQTYEGKFKADYYEFAGLTFNWQFNNFVQGDQLNIYDRASSSYAWSLAFTMNPYLIQSQAQPSSGSQPTALKGTISIANAVGSRKHDLKFTLTSPQANSTSQVTISNLMQYGNSFLFTGARQPAATSRAATRLLRG